MTLDVNQRKHLHDDLRGLVRGELLFDDLTRALHATDASLFEVQPAGIIVPRDEEDLAALVRYAGENDLPLIARGAGTGLAGESLGAGLVVDFSAGFTAILDIGTDTLTAQPGVTLRQIERALAPLGRRLGPDPDNVECTLGGMLATNASGPRVHRLGTMRDHIVQVRAVLDTGEINEVGCVSRWPSSLSPGRLEDIISATGTLLEQNRELIERRGSVPIDRCGYGLAGVLGQQHLDLARLLVGSEGTLALFTAATIRTLKVPGGRSMVLLGFARLESALRAARQVAESSPTLCELLDRRLLRLARSEPAVTVLVPEEAEAVLILEYEGETMAEAREKGRDIAARLVRQERTGLFARVAQDEVECDSLGQLRRAALPGLHSLRRGARPLSIVEDIAVPPDRLLECLPRLQDILRRQETTASFLIRPLTGQIHLRPFLDLQDPRDADRLWPLADEVYGVVLELGGTVSAQHGTGLARMPWVGRQLGPLANVHRELKAIFDPRFLFNPGKIVAGPTNPVTWPLRRRPDAQQLRSQDLESANEAGILGNKTTLLQEALACHGCGECRTDSSNTRMCPVFRASLAEAATPRAKANLMRLLLLSDSDPAQMGSDEVRAIADLCVNCKMCVRECPSRVQVPQLMLEAKAANVARHGLNRADSALARLESFAWLGSALAPLVNPLLGHPVTRFLLERFFGVTSRRRLPAFAPRSFLRLARQRGWTRKPRSARPRVAYFVDVFANYNDPSVAEAVVAVLHHNGIEVYVPPGQVGCGMAPLTYGDVDAARELIKRNVRVLADLAREGFPILCSEPSAALLFRQDAALVFDDADTRLVAGQVVEFTAFVDDLHKQGLLRTDFTPLSISLGHHVPCHIKALDRPPMGPGLLALIPELRVGTIDVSCSGMAGTFGFKTERFDLSMQAGAPMLRELSKPAYLFGSTECSACRIQMEDGSGKRTLHPAQYLALAYGLMPRLRERLATPIERVLS